MANRIEKGGIYIASKVRKGDSSRGMWKMIIVNNDNGKDGIKCFVSEETVDVDVVEGQSFKVKDILAYNHKKRKNDEGKWVQDDNLSINVEKVDVEFSDGTNPFNIGTNPFESANPFEIANPFEAKNNDDGELPF